MRVRIHYTALLIGAAASAQSSRPLQFDVVYSCSSGRTKLKVMSCTGPADGDSCEARYIDTSAANGLGAPIGASRKSLTELLQTCVVLRPPAKVDSAPPPASRPPQSPAPSQRPTPAPAAAPQAVRPPQPEVQTRAAPPQQAATPVRPPALKAGTPPKPGLTSCAGQIEGRYALSGGFGSMTIIFRSGKAFLPEVMGNGPPEEYECWTGGGQVILHQPGNPNHIPDMQLDINNDGTLQAPFGELKKKGN